MRTAIVYDRVNKWGGAERVLLALNELFPDAPLYTSLYSSNKARWAEVFPQVVPSFLNKLTFLRDKHQLLALLMPLAFESFDFDKFDLVISVTSEAAKGVITKPHTKHICYCLTPTRYLWSGYGEYFKGETISILAKPAVSYLRNWDRIASERPDVMVAISTDVKKRIKKYYGRDSKIIYPPVETGKFNVQKSKLRSANKYYLIVSRLEQYKKVDLAVRAFNQLGYPLVIIGTGSEKNRIKSIAQDNIIFKGFVKDNELISYYRNAKGFVFPQEEDFGIAAVESQAAGCPVIAYKGGGSLDTVVENKTGVFFKTQNCESLVKAVKRFDSMKFDKETLHANAERFNKAKFKKEIMDTVKKTV